MALPNSHRVRILERNGVRFAYINGRLIPIAAEAKVCQYCDKKINPLTEDYEIHVVKCMTKPRVKGVGQLVNIELGRLTPGVFMTRPSTFPLCTTPSN